MKFVKILWKGIGALVITACSVFESPTQQTLIHYYVQLSEVNLTQADSVAIDYWINNEPQAHHEVQRVVEEMAVFDLETARDNQVIVRVRVYNSGALISTRVDNFVAGVIGAAPDLEDTPTPVYSAYNLSIKDTLDLLALYASLSIIDCNIESNSNSLSYTVSKHCKLVADSTGVSDLKLTLVDESGLRMQSHVNLTVVQGLPQVDLSANMRTAKIGQIVNFTATASDPNEKAQDGSIVQYEWDFDGDGVYDATTTPNSTSHAYPNDYASHTYYARVRVTDDDSNTTVSSAFPITVTSRTPVVSVSAVKTNLLITDSTTVQATLSDADSNVVDSLYWDLDANGVFETKSHHSKVQKIKFTAPEGGNKVIKVYGYDQWGDKVTASVTISVTPNRAPVVSQINASTTTISIKKYAVLKINSGDFTDADNNQIDSVTWIFSDGASSCLLGKNDTLHVLRNSAQSLTVQAVVRDVWGLKDTAQVTLTYSKGAVSVTDADDIKGVFNAQIQLNPSVSFSLGQSLTLCEWSINGGIFNSVGNTCDTTITLPNTFYNDYQAVFRATSDVGVQYLDTLHILVRDGFKDARDGKVYAFVTIGTQVWMADNLNYGAMVSGFNGQVNDAAVEKFCYYNNATNCTTDGGLYTWAETMSLPSSCNGVGENLCASQISSGNHQGICPTGWHVPKSDEWTTLASYLGGVQVAGKKMKFNITGSNGWDTGNNNDGNSSGFSAIPTGFCGAGDCFSRGFGTYYWEATEYNASWANFRSLDYGSSFLNAGYDFKGNGFSVRCLKD